VEGEFTYQFSSIIAVLNVGTSLQYFSFEARNMIFMNENGKVMAELTDEKWLWNLHCSVISAGA
jgi:hypothetical protein